MSKQTDHKDKIERMLSLVDEVNVEIRHLRHQFDLLTAEGMRLQAIVDSVLTTADGKLIYPGCGIDRVWSIVWSQDTQGADGVPYLLPLHFLEFDDESTSDVMIEDSTGYSDFIEKCYSTYEAAVAAKLESKPETKGENKP